MKELCHVYEAVHPARTRWYDIGLQLGLPSDTLDSIEHEKGNSGESLRNMLKTWLKECKATWGALPDALKSRIVGEGRLAEKLTIKLDVRAQGKMLQLQSTLLL